MGTREKSGRQLLREERQRERRKLQSELLAKLDDLVAAKGEYRVASPPPPPGPAHCLSLVAPPSSPTQLNFVHRCHIQCAPSQSIEFGEIHRKPHQRCTCLRTRFVCTAESCDLSQFVDCVLQVVHCVRNSSFSSESTICRQILRDAAGFSLVCPRC